MGAALLVACMMAGAEPASTTEAPVVSEEIVWNDEEVAWSEMIDSYLQAHAESESLFPQYPLVGAAPMVGVSADQEAGRANTRAIARKTGALVHAPGRRGSKN